MDWLAWLRSQHQTKQLENLKIVSLDLWAIELRHKCLWLRGKKCTAKYLNATNSTIIHSCRLVKENLAYLVGVPRYGLHAPRSPCKTHTRGQRGRTIGISRLVMPVTAKGLRLLLSAFAHPPYVTEAKLHPWRINPGIFQRKTEPVKTCFSSQVKMRWWTSSWNPVYCMYFN